jgi:hypothetical protein
LPPIDIDDGFATEIFGQPNVARKVDARGVVVELRLLWPDADGDGFAQADVGFDGLEHHLQANVAGNVRGRPFASVTSPATNLGRAEEAYDEHVVGIVVEVERGADLLDPPLFKTTIRFAMVMASTWSCVTWIMVDPSAI